MCRSDGSNTTALTAGPDSGSAGQLKASVGGHLDEIRDSDTVAEDTVRSTRVSLDDVIVHTVQQRDDRIVGVWPLYLVGMPLIETELAVS